MNCVFCRAAACSPQSEWRSSHDVNFVTLKSEFVLLVNQRDDVCPSGSSPCVSDPDICHHKSLMYIRLIFPDEQTVMWTLNDSYSSSWSPWMHHVCVCALCAQMGHNNKCSYFTDCSCDAAVMLVLSALCYSDVCTVVVHPDLSLLVSQEKVTHVLKFPVCLSCVSCFIGFFGLTGSLSPVPINTRTLSGTFKGLFDSQPSVSHLLWGMTLTL